MEKMQNRYLIVIAIMLLTSVFVHYFYKAGDFVGQSYIKLRLNLALNKYGRKEKSGSLIRVSTPVFREDYKSASIMLTSFIGDLYPYLSKYL